ncbi:MAG: hypothetical protein KI793_21385 [Rivularia sp. (in: Bacteria)]|nr:hypothetical protein [Rivularia sp. MS3]
MTNLTFSQELAMALYNSDEQFPIDFDEAWVWLRYNKKQQAKEKLVRNFEKGLDFEVFTQMSVNSTQQASQPPSGRPKEVIKITVECLKSFGMMAGTEQGKIIRRYFLECEKIVRAKVIAETAPLTPAIEKIKEATVTVLSIASIHPNLIAGVVANEIGKHHPELIGTMEEAKKLLPLPVEDRLLSVTKLSELYSNRTGTKLSARKMNQRLKELGLQYQNPNKEPAWMPTELGEPHAKVILQEAAGNNKTVQQLRWFPSVLELMN